MCVLLYIYIHTYIYTNIYIQIYIYTYIYIYIYRIFFSKYIYIYTHVDTRLDSILRQSLILANHPLPGSCKWSVTELYPYKFDDPTGTYEPGFLTSWLRWSKYSMYFIENPHLHISPVPDLQELSCSSELRKDMTGELCSQNWPTGNPSILVGMVA